MREEQIWLSISKISDSGFGYGEIDFIECKLSLFLLCLPAVIGLISWEDYN